MSNNAGPMKYNGFDGSMEFSMEDECLYGEILFIQDLVMYHAETVSKLKEAFIEAVDQYLADCKELNKEPCKPFSGSFNVRISPETHKELSIKAKAKGVSLNKISGDAFEFYLKNHGAVKVDVTHTHNHLHQVELTGTKLGQVNLGESIENQKWKTTSVRMQ